MTDRIALGGLTVPGGYFVDRPRSAVPFVAGPDTDAAYRHRFTYAGSRSDIRRTLVAMLAAARRKVFVASWLLGDDELVDHLVGAAERLRGGVYVISALRPRDIADAAALEDHLPESEQMVKRRFEALTRRGVYVRARPGCHAKFVVVDDDVALVSSANLTTRALDETGENGVVVTDPPEVDRLARLFARLWHDCSLEVPPGTGYRIADAARTPWRGTVPPPVTDRPGVIWTCDDEHHILAAVRSLIASAREDLLLATFSVDGMRAHPDLVLDPARAAVERGVRVRMLVRARNNVAGHRADLVAFAEAGVEVVGDSLSHAKGVVADRRRGALFSANFEAAHGLRGGVEVGARLDGTPALDEAVRYFTHVMEHADQAFVVDPTVAELDQGLRSSWRSPWPLAREVRVTATDRDWRRLADAARAGGPVLFERSDGPLSIYAGESRWRLTPIRDGAAHTLALERANDQPATARLADWFGRRRRDAPRAARGLCPATFERTTGHTAKEGPLVNA